MSLPEQWRDYAATRKRRNAAELDWERAKYELLLAERECESADTAYETNRLGTKSLAAKALYQSTSQHWPAFKKASAQRDESELRAERAKHAWRKACRHEEAMRQEYFHWADKTKAALKEVLKQEEKTDESLKERD